MSFAIKLPDSVTLYDGPTGMAQVMIRNRAASASIALQGAHILSFVPAGQQDLLWMSDDATYAKGKSLRGGIPICWPWFGAHNTDPKLPAHGHARTSEWSLIKAEDLGTDTTRLLFELKDSTDNRYFWGCATRVRYSVTIGRELSLCLETTNLERRDITIGAALHTYFRIGDIEQTTVDGLNDCDYLDKVAGFARKPQTGLVRFNSEVDRIYLNTPQRCEIRDPLLQRRIIIHSQGSHSTVVWNPGQIVADKMGDLGQQGYRHMLCVETANAAEDTQILAPNQVHRLSASYRITAY